MKLRHVAIIACMVLAVFVSGQAVASSQTVKIGVLAKNGPVKAMQMWKSTADFLNANVSGKSFEIVPLGFEEVNPAIEGQQVDFFLVNSSMFVTAKVKYEATEIATMINSRQGKPLKSFGGVIFTSAFNDDIESIADLNGRNFMAVQESSFGGWQMAYKEILDAGLDPLQSFSKLEFGGKHDNVVLAVINGVADAGTVRTDTLERMAAAGDIDLQDVKIIAQKEHAGFPFVCSTALYPEWPLAALKSTPGDLSRQVVEALKLMKQDDKAARDAKIVGWTDPLDYQPVLDLQMKLKVGAFSE